MREYSEDFEIQDGVLIKYKGKGGHVVIPDGVACIGFRAFDGCKNLTNITIPDSVTSIGDDAFQCYKITIYAHEGTYAEEYARENGIPFAAKN